MTGNKYGKYYGTHSMLKTAPSANIHMAQANENRTPVTDVTFLNQTIGLGLGLGLRLRLGLGLGLGLGLEVGLGFGLGTRG